MRYCASALGLAAMSTAAFAQSGDWQFYETDNGLLQAFVLADDGTQLILKCDKAGKRQVYAALVMQEQIAPPTSSYERRTLHFRADDGQSSSGTWRYYETTAMAINKRGENTLLPFLREVAGAKEVTVELEPVQKSNIFVTFKVHGARSAIDRVFAACQDKSLID